MLGTPASRRTEFTFEKSKYSLFLLLQYGLLHCLSHHHWLVGDPQSGPLITFPRFVSPKCLLLFGPSVTACPAWAHALIIPHFLIAEVAQNSVVGKLFMAEAADSSDEEQDDSYFSV